MTGRKPKKLSAFLWHRRIGLLAIVLVIILAVTGILLNHTEAFKLDERYVESSLLLQWYGLEPEGEAISYDVGEHVITVLEHQVFFNTYPVVVGLGLLAQTVLLPLTAFGIIALFDLAPERSCSDYGFEQQAALVEEFVCCRALDPAGARTAELTALIHEAFPAAARDDGVPPDGLRLPWSGAQTRGICS